EAFQLSPNQLVSGGAKRLITRQRNVQQRSVARMLVEQLLATLVKASGARIACAHELQLHLSDERSNWIGAALRHFPRIGQIAFGLTQQRQRHGPRYSAQQRHGIWSAVQMQRGTRT